jgi:hypothetical protein
MEGSTVALCQLALEQSELEVESLVWSHRAHSASCALVMVMISPSWRCNLSALSAEGGGSMSRSVAATATF